MKFNVSLTWKDWWPQITYNSRTWPDYFSIGIGPVWIEIYWGSDLAPWE